MRITLQDIADKLGVTKAAVSMALRNNSRISAERRKEIQRIASELGYEPDPFLSRLSAYRAQKNVAQPEGVIAWLNHWNEPKSLRGFHEFDLYWRGAKEAARRLGYLLEEVIWTKDRSAKEVEQELTARGVLGLLLPPHKRDVDWQDFDWKRFSLVRFGLSVRKPDSNLVTSDHQRAMVMAVKKIHEVGYRRIGLIFSWEHDRSIGGNIYGGFIWASSLLGIQNPIPPLDSETDGTETTAVAKRNLQTWLKRHKPDAILTTRPETMSLLRELGYRVPGDIAVAGTSVYDIPVNAGIDQRPKAIGRVAAKMLIKQISLNERGELADPCRILVESRWKDGKTLPRKTPAEPSARRARA
jgi:LacI family transcriptional regulator